MQNIICSFHIGLHRLHREELTAGDLLQRCGVEDIIHAWHRVCNGAGIPDIPDIKLHLIRIRRISGLQLVPHVVLFFFIPAEDPDRSDICRQKVLHYRVSEGSGPACDHQGCAVKCDHVPYSPVI